MNRVLLTVSGTIPEDLLMQIAAGNRPTADYVAMADAFGADLIDYAEAHRSSRLVGKVLRRVGGDDLVLAVACLRRRKRYETIVTDGEQVGLPLAALLKYLHPLSRRRPRHHMIAHIMSVRKKMLFLDRLGVQSHIDTFITYASWQQQFIRDRWSLPAHRVVLSPFMVDDRFFAPGVVEPAPKSRPLICAVGLERRDYPTLLAAVDGLDLDVVIAAASPWSKQADTTEGRRIPANVTVRKFTQFELRQLYADSDFLVMPLDDVEFQAGVTAILEAMAMERAVVCTRTRGQTDVVVDGVNGRYVPPGDIAALRTAIRDLAADPAEAQRLGRNGRRTIETQMNLDHYVRRLTQLVGGEGRRLESARPAGAMTDGEESAMARIAIVGCGYVADYYLSTLAGYPEIEIVGVFDRVQARAVTFAAHHGVPRYNTIDEVLGDERVDVVVNLTNPREHYGVSQAALTAGKHVYSEKPLAMDLEEARELVELAERSKLWISSAPCSLLGEAAQTIWKAVRDEAVGPVRAIYAEMDEGLVHQMPFQAWASESGKQWPFEDEFEVGTVIEHAGYVVTWLPAMFGPVVSITGFADCLVPDKGGVATDATDFAVVVLKFASGVVARLTCTLIAPHDHSLRIVGDKGVLSTNDTWFYGSPVYVRKSINIKRRHQWLPKRKLALVGKTQKYDYRGTQQMDFARGIADLVDAIRAGRPPRLSPRYCLHANEIVLAVSHAMRTSSSYTMTTTFDPVAPMPWAE